MNTKEYLSQAYRLDQRINCKLEQAMYLKELAMKATSCIASEKVSGSKMRSPMENAICKLVDLESEINIDIDKLVDLKRDLTTILSSVKDQSYRLLLELRYLGGKTWEDIAITMGYDVRWVYRMHGRALQEVNILFFGTPFKRT